MQSPGVASPRLCSLRCTSVSGRLASGATPCPLRAAAVAGMARQTRIPDTARLQDQYRLDLELGALGQAGHAHGGARRERLRDDLGHDGVGRRELVEVGQEQSQLDDVVEGAARLFDDGLHVGESLAHLGVEVLRDQVAGAGFEADLSGQVDRLAAGDSYRLRVRADGGRGGVGMDDLLAHGPYPWGRSVAIDWTIEV